MMKITFQRSLIKYLLLIISIVLFSGCAKNDKLILKTYSPPAERDKVKEMMAKSTSSESYLDLYINDDSAAITAITNGKTRDKSVAETLLANVKNYLTQTNFIGINQDTDSNTVSLEMKIIGYSYESSDNRVKAFLEVAFIFIKDEKDRPIYSPVYKANVYRQSSAGKQTLPSRAEVLSILTKDIASNLIMDVSPLKSRKMVELKPLPKALAYTIKYAKMKNYKGAIKAMEKYQGKKTMEYYFNLAVYYEAYASTLNDISLLKNADENYEKSMMNGGMEDDIVIKAKAKFDNFYDLIKEIDQQKKSNKNANHNRDNEIL